MLMALHNTPSHSGSQVHLDFLIIGVQRSASTWLQEMIRRHPKIYLPRGEVAFFEDPDYEEKGLAWLANKLEAAPPESLVGIKRPTDFMRQECPARIARDFPRAKFIVVLRNPVQRAISACYHMMRIGLWDFGSVDARITQLLDDPTGPDPVHVLANGCFGAALSRYLTYFPREQIHLELHHEVLADPMTALTNVCSFLGVEPELQSMETGRVINGGIYASGPMWLSNHLHRLRYHIDSELGRVYEKNSLAGKVGTVATYLFNYGMHATEGVGNIAGRPCVSAQNKQRLLEYYLADIAKLEAMTGFDLSTWKSV